MPQFFNVIFAVYNNLMKETYLHNYLIIPIKLSPFGFYSTQIWQRAQKDVAKKTGK
jgi:hypothetical protein